MSRALVFALAFAVGLSFRRRESIAFAVLFRAQLVLLTSSLAFVAAWTFAWTVADVAGVAVLLAAELGALAAGVWLLRRGAAVPLAVVSSTSNSGFWSIPVAGAFAGAPGAAFAVLYDTLSLVRNFVVVRLLRRHAPVRPAARSGAIDYLPQIALAAGFLARLVAEPPGVAAWMPEAGVAFGAVGFGLLGMAMPYRIPVSQDWRATVPALALRFAVPFAACVAATAAGVRLPDAVWVLALAPTPFAVVSFARVYGYRRELAAAVPLVSVPIATALLPVVRLLVR